MNHAKYIGLDVHQATISVAVRDSAGKLVMDGLIRNSYFPRKYHCGLLRLSGTASIPAPGLDQQSSELQ